MIDFSTLQGLTIPEGVVTQIADASGRVIWALQSGTKAVLQVAKQTLNTYAGETEYTGESFVAIDVYPTKNGTVKVTYGGLTKTVKDTSGVENPNAQTVYFGTLYGVADGVATPDSGELIIEGQFNEFGCGVYRQKGKLGEANAYCGCITAVSEWGDITAIPGNAFYNCTNLALTSLPSGVTSIGNYAFYNCTNLALTSLPSGVIGSIGNYAFYKCTNLALTSLPSGVTRIGNYAFNNCTNLALTSLPSGVTSIGNYAFQYCSKVCIQAFPEGIVSIGDYAFEMKQRIDTSMRYGSITLPSSLESIGARAFAVSKTYDSTYSDAVYAYLSEIIMLGTTPPTIPDAAVFGSFTYIVDRNGNNGRIIVPAGCIEVYDAAENWAIYISTRGVEAS